MAPPMESTTLPRDFCYTYDIPTTPEPSAVGELQPPSPPRPVRGKIKRRAGPTFTGATASFLASVAAADSVAIADTPIPTIETSMYPEDEDMMDSFTSSRNTDFLIPDYRTSPPKTPLPQIFTDMDSNANQRPNWYMNTPGSPDSLVRPSSSNSNPSEWSDDSHFTGSFSRPSDDGSCTSPESEMSEPFKFPSFPRAKGKKIKPEECPLPKDIPNAGLRSRTRNNATWSKDMSEHLWRTYQIYLQDPTVTPFRIGPNSVPPEGVIYRVSREAKRSWKGQKSKSSSQYRTSSLSIESSVATIKPTSRERCDNLTPNTAIPKAYIQWPHSSNATRNHLRFLCKSKDSAISVQLHRHLQSRSPTPFSQAQPRGCPREIFTPAESRVSSFCTKDISLSLATSSSASMQPDGPLAQLAWPSKDLPTHHIFQDLFSGINTSDVTQEGRVRRLGSPFDSHTYGPSFSKSLNSTLKPSQGQRLSTGSLKAPLDFPLTKSLTGTQKRRAQHALDEELSPSGGIVRPSILDNRIFDGPAEVPQRRVRRSRGFSLGDEALMHRSSGPFMAPPPPKIAQKQADITSPTRGSGNSSPSLLPAPNFSIPQFNHQIPESGLNATFPRRLFQTNDGTATVRRRPYATFNHQMRRSIETFDFSNGTHQQPLENRLAQIGQRLADIKDREATDRSESKD
jgi:hypothetical protein